MIAKFAKIKGPLKIGDLQYVIDRAVLWWSGICNSSDGIYMRKGTTLCKNLNLHLQHFVLNYTPSLPVAISTVC